MKKLAYGHIGNKLADPDLTPKPMNELLVSQTVECSVYAQRDINLMESTSMFFVLRK